MYTHNTSPAKHALLRQHSPSVSKLQLKRSNPLQRQESSVKSQVSRVKFEGSSVMCHV